MPKTSPAKPFSVTMMTVQSIRPQMISYSVCTKNNNNKTPQQSRFDSAGVEAQADTCTGSPELDFTHGFLSLSSRSATGNTKTIHPAATSANRTFLFWYPLLFFWSCPQQNGITFRQCSLSARCRESCDTSENSVPRYSSAVLLSPDNTEGERDR